MRRGRVAVGAGGLGSRLRDRGCPGGSRFGFEDLDLDEIVSFTVPGNVKSRAVMERLGMTRDPADDFENPNLPGGTRSGPTSLYRLRRDAWRAALWPTLVRGSLGVTNSR